jgi:hypothetical protein
MTASNNNCKRPQKMQLVINQLLKGQDEACFALRARLLVRPQYFNRIFAHVCLQMQGRGAECI